MENPEMINYEQSSFDVILNDIGPNKVGVIKVIKEITNLGLKEATALITKLPVMIKENVTREEAGVLVIKLQDAGATAQCK